MFLDKNHAKYEFPIDVADVTGDDKSDFYMLKDAPTVKVYTSDMVEVLAEYIMTHKVIDFEPVNNIRVIR